MKVKFKFGIKSFSGTVDQMTFSNYDSRDVTISREYNPDQAITANNNFMGSVMQKIALLYNNTTPEYKTNLATYATRMFMLPEYQGSLAGNKFSCFAKMFWGYANTLADASARTTWFNSLTVDDMDLGSYDTYFTNIYLAIGRGYLPEVATMDDLEVVWRDLS